VKSHIRVLYCHPAFAPHRLLRAMGLNKFWAQNAVITMFAIIVLTFCAWLDHSFIIQNGYGYFQHPGIWGWYLIQFIMPVAIYRTLKAATRSSKHYLELVKDKEVFSFRGNVFDPMIAFIGLNTPVSRSLFAFLFLIGFVGFAGNTFQNLYPGKLAPLDFWDSIDFPFGYFGSRVYKFYIDALLLPAIVHIFAGIVWTNIDVIRFLNKQRKVRLIVFHQDKCGGFGFLADLILTPTVSTLLVSSLAFFGVVYTHRAFDTATAFGILIQVTILTVFYVIPTFVLRSALKEAKKLARREVHLKQQSYYEDIVSETLHGEALRDAHEYLRYFNDISTTVDNVPEWPHLARVSRVFGISVSPAVISFVVTLANTLKKFYPNLP